MGYVIAVYTENAFKEFLLPPINNSDYTLILYRSFFELKDDVKIKLEVINGKWKILGSEGYIIDGLTEEDQADILMDGKTLQLITRDREVIRMFVHQEEEELRACDKYDISSCKAITIGSSDDNAICYPHNLVSGTHAILLRKSYRQWEIQDRSRNGVYVNSAHVKESQELHFGDMINIMGLVIIFMGDCIAVDAGDKSVRINHNILREYYYDEKNEENQIGNNDHGIKKLVHRSPRIMKRLREDTVEIEEPPEMERRKSMPFMMAIGPSVTMALPMLIGCAMMVAASKSMGGSGSNLYLYSGLIMSISSAIIAVFWTIENMRYETRSQRENESHRFEVYRNYLYTQRNRIKEAYEYNKATLFEMYPGPAECLDYDEKSLMLWNRNLEHGDFLSCRLGIGNIPFQENIVIPKDKFSMFEDSLRDKPEFIQSNYSTLYQVPILVDLMKYRVMGLIGGADKKGAYDIARILSLQIAASNCYTDVKLVYVYDDENTTNLGQWDFARWLPHVWAEDKKTRFIASSKAEASNCFYELLKVFRRREESDSNKKSSKKNIPHYVFFISDLSMLENELISKYLFDSEQDYGVSVVILSDRYDNLPNSCEYFIENSQDYQGIYGFLDENNTRTDVTFDSLKESELETFSRKLSNLEVRETEAEGEIPTSLTFFDMYGIRALDELKVEDRWLKNRTYDNIRALIGEKAGGAPCYLDLHEKYHGPHGLIAGTTGSGKSETLQTAMLSLAINYSPDDIGFFIIDYKGGGLANLFEGLPHMIGQISNLSGNQIRRAMVSIKSENRRRQQLFNEAGVNNINEYTKLVKNGTIGTPIPHLLIIIDEFAELKREEPEFMQELVSVAQVGRSLGVHLILSTQKPSGTVDDNIWSNAKFHLCLRVQDRQDSNDMLHHPDAAYITQTGRGYLQVGSDEVYDLFQSGWSGAYYDKEKLSGKDDIVAMIGLDGQVMATGETGTRNKSKGAEPAKRATQLDVVRDYLVSIARSKHYVQKNQLWMPILKDHIYLTRTEGARYNSDRGDICVEMGMFDDPENQKQFPIVINFSEKGNLSVYGSVVSGKSTFLQTLVYALVTRYSPRAVNLYCIDFSSKMLSAFEGCPHVGGVLYEEDQEKIGRFFHMISRISEERKKIFRGGSYSQYKKIHGTEYPAIFIVIDNFSSFNEKTESRYEDFLITLSKEGISRGIYLVVTAEGNGMNELPHRIADNITNSVCLQMSERMDYADLLRTNRIEVMPESGVKGRGLALYGSRVLEFQTALSLEAEDDFTRITKIKEKMQGLSELCDESRAAPVPEIPDKPVLEEFLTLPDVKAAINDPGLLPIGYDKKSAEIYSLPLSQTYCYLITGEKKTGRRNLIKVMVETAKIKEASICIFDTGEMALKKYADDEAISYCATEDQIFNYCLNTLTTVFPERNRLRHSLEEEEYEEDEIFDVMKQEKPYFVFIPDILSFFRLADRSDKEITGFFKNLFQKGSGHNIYFIAALDISEKNEARGYDLYDDFVKEKNGIHFGGKVSDNGIFNFSYIGYQREDIVEKPGIGMLPETNGQHDVEKVIIPLVRKRRNRRVEEGK